MRSSLSRLFALLLVIAVGLITGYTVAKFTHAASASVSDAPAPSATTTTTVVNIQLAALAALIWSLATLATGLWLLRGWIARQWSRFTARLELALEGLFDFESVDETPSGRRISIQNSTVKGDVVAGRLLYRVPSVQADKTEQCAHCGVSHGRQDLLVGISQADRDTYALYKQRFPHSGSALRQRMDALHRKANGHLDSEASNAAILAHMRRECEACAQGALDDAAKTTCTACGELGHWSPDCPNLGLLPCRGCSWCGKDPGNLPAAEWTECDGSGFYLPTRAQHERINVRMQRPSPQPKQNAVVSSTPETFEAKGARLKREADAWSPENNTSWPFGQCGPKPPPSTSSSNDC